MPAPYLPMRLKPNDPHVLALAEESIAKGHSIPTLASELGVHESTLYGWLEHSEAEEHGAPPGPELGSCIHFSQALKRGLRAFEEANVQVISDARAPKPGGWQPAAWLLERRLPDRWGQKRDIHVDARKQTIVLSDAVSPDVLGELERRASLPEARSSEGITENEPTQGGNENTGQGG